MNWLDLSSHFIIFYFCSQYQFIKKANLETLLYILKQQKSLTITLTPLILEFYVILNVYFKKSFLTPNAEFWDWCIMFRLKVGIFDKTNGDFLLTIRYHFKFLKIFHWYLKHASSSENDEENNEGTPIAATLLKMKVTERCRLGTRGEKTIPPGTIGWHTDLEMWLRYPTGRLKRIKVLRPSNCHKYGTLILFTYRGWRSPELQPVFL